MCRAWREVGILTGAQSYNNVLARTRKCSRGMGARPRYGTVIANARGFIFAAAFYLDRDCWILSVPAVQAQCPSAKYL